MGRRRKIWIAVAGIAALAAGALWLQGSTAPAPVPVSVGTGLPGGVYDAVGRSLAELADGDVLTITAVPTAASVENLSRVRSGDLDAGFALADVAALAMSKPDPSEAANGSSGVQELRAVARLYDNSVHLVVRAASPYDGLEELAGARVSLGAENSGTEVIAERLLEVAGISATVEGNPAGAEGNPEGVAAALRLGLGASVAALERDEIDAFFWSGGLPTDAITSLASRVPIRLLDVSAAVSDLTASYGAFYAEAPILADTYPGVAPVRTVSVPSLLVVGSEMPDDVAAALTRAVLDSREELARLHPATYQLSPRTAVATSPVPLHPGAARYYREAKPFA
ncbi:TAXI family TRAP transporter solute-binding subunit [Leucobacter sp. NPDC015123]|uniref:TAXI family TRAP transporter solute-binding subunit n=1 Tax=Leucobacter sp. NPDC015123 TaxID=3364129 RepID=UPI0036F47456